MSNLVSGYSGIIAPPNLATNGSFRINQRQLFTSASAPAKNGDYVSDCWKLTNCTVDQMIVGSNTNGNITISGHAKKNQVIEIHGRDFANLGESYYLSGASIANANSHVLTASVLVAKQGGVPFSVAAIPRYTNAGGTIYKNGVTVYNKENESKLTDTFVIGNRGYTMDNPDRIEIQILEDGYYVVRLSNFMLVSGMYRNMPRSAPVHLADDLARCQRYYQKGNLNDVGVFASYNADAVIRTPVQFTAEMVAVPTVAVTSVSSGYYNGAGVYTGFTPSHGTVGIKTTGFSCSTSTNDGTAVTQLTSNGGETDFNWVAEVV